METKFFLNGVEKQIPEGAISLEDLLREVMEEQCRLDRIVTEVKIDGKIFSEVYEHQAADIPLAGIGCVELETQDQDEFARDFVGKTHHFIDQLKDGFSLAAKLLDSPSTIQEGYSTMAMSFEAMQNLKGHIEAVSGVLESAAWNGRETAMWNDFERLADRIISSQQTSDPSFTASLLKDQMPVMLDEWKEIRAEAVAGI